MSSRSRILHPFAARRRRRRVTIVCGIVATLCIGGYAACARMNREAAGAVTVEPVPVESSAPADETVLLEPVPESEPMPAFLSSRTGPSSESSRRVADYISRVYKVSQAKAQNVTEWALEIGESRDVDPLLILAVVAMESSYNARARSRAGAEGLMQVMTKIHHKKFEPYGGREAALEPYPSMAVGTDILLYLIGRTGNVTTALKWYSGAANQEGDGGYGAKVLQERSRLLVAARGDTEGAVRLSQNGRSGPAYRSGAVVKRLGFGHWREIEKASAKKAETAG